MVANVWTGSKISSWTSALEYGFAAWQSVGKKDALRCCDRTPTTPETNLLWAMSKSQLLKPGGREACEQQDAVRMVNYEFSGLSFDLQVGVLSSSSRPEPDVSSCALI
jgi:hypothetical protein